MSKYQKWEIQMNDLAEKYIKEEDHERKQHIKNQVSEVFDSYMKRKYYYIAINGVKNFDYWEVQGQLEDSFLKVLDSYISGNDFVKLLKVSLKRKKISLHRKQKTKNKYMMYKNTKEDDEGNEIDLIDSVQDINANIEEYVVRKYSKKSNEEKKGLVNYFADRNNDPVTVRILEEIPKRKNLNQVADALGIHNTTVRRKLDKLKKHFDPNIFGDYEDYLVN